MPQCIAAFVRDGRAFRNGKRRRFFASLRTRKPHCLRDSIHATHTTKYRTTPGSW
ncbi:hypothetical protein ACFPRL_16135 [Pseudoclavibacter helvolus]